MTIAFFWDRKVTIRRPAQGSSEPGYIGYSANIDDDETIVLTNLTAAIEPQSNTVSTTVHPTGAPVPVRWSIYIRRGQIASDTAILNRDIAVDDLNRRFQITSADPTKLGYRLQCVRLEI